MLNELGKDFGNAMVFMGILLLIFIPLGIWKLIDIIIWLFNHIKINFQF